MHTNVSFYRRAHEALHDARLQGALDLATSRMVSARTTAFAAFPDGDAVRDHARRIRAHTLSRLDHYLDRFTENVEARGGHVFYAESGDQAVEYIRSLARSRHVRSIVKGKSMISEELELNRALEADGMTIVETDLGEYVIQIGNDHPSHIVAPIVHLTRHDVAALFKRTLGATDAEVADIGAMTALARRVLREAFLGADMGISGVNFAVAETGSVCLCTNEGNGRLTTSLPRIHVALMGIERIVPTLDDLGVMLQVLARSATGQKLTVYSNLLTGPRRSPGEPDGPEELHVVLVDNGRAEVLGGELAEILYCIRCGACLNVCPVYQEIGGHAYGTVYGGPIGSVLTPGLRGIVPFKDLPQASSLCGACREACPVRIDIPRMLVALRTQSVTESPAWLRAGMSVYTWLATRPAAFRLAGRVGGAMLRWRSRDGWIDRLPGPLKGWTSTRAFPAPPKRSFLAKWQAEHAGRPQPTGDGANSTAGPTGNTPKAGAQ